MRRLNDRRNISKMRFQWFSQPKTYFIDCRRKIVWCLKMHSPKNYIEYIKYWKWFSWWKGYLLFFIDKVKYYIDKKNWANFIFVIIIYIHLSKDIRYQEILIPPRSSFPPVHLCQCTESNFQWIQHFKKVMYTFPLVHVSINFFFWHKSSRGNSFFMPTLRKWWEKNMLEFSLL